jgi:Tfp pilus assembly protein PilN
MTQVNLLPAEVKQRQRTRRSTGLIISGAVAVVALLFLLFVMQSARLGKAQDELAAQQQFNAGLQAQISDLQQYADLKAQVSAKQAVVAEALQDEVLWSGALRDLSMVIPSNMWLVSMAGTVTSQTGAAPVAGTVGTAPDTGIIGNIQFTGTSFTQPTLAEWLKRLSKVDGWANPWVSQSTKGQTGNQTTFQFSGSVDLTTGATVDGGAS